MQDRESGPKTATAYVTAVISCGAAAIAWSLIHLWLQPVGYGWLLLAALTILSGAANIKIRSIPASLSISETFVFIGALLFGVPVAIIIVAIDGLVISLSLAKGRRELRRVLFNVACPAIAVWVGASTLFELAGIQPLSVRSSPIGALIGPVLVFALIYFLFNSLLVAIVIALHSDQSAASILKNEFFWVSLNCFAGASIAFLVVAFTRELSTTFLVVIVPLLLLTYVNHKTSVGRIDDANEHLSTLNRLYLSTIEALAMAIDAKDQVTHGHIRRVQIYAVGLAGALGVKDRLILKAIEAAALLHDTGKLAVPEYILNKPGKLTSAEFEKMKLHATVGADILSSVDFPFPVVPIVRHHHENWDGTGYPASLQGTDIPIGARILSVVDCFDALTSDRPYRPRLSDDEAIAILMERRGTMYDPLVVDTFVRVHHEIAPPEPEQVPQPAHRSGLAEISRVSTEAAVGSPAKSHALDDITASTDEMLTLYDLATSLGGQTKLADTAEIIARHLRRLVPAALYVFYLYDREKDDLVAGHASGHGDSAVRGLRIPLGERLSGWVAANRQTIVNSDPVLDLGDTARSAKPRLTYCLSTSLLADSRLVGVLTLYAAGGHQFTEDHRRILEAVSRQISRTVERSAAFEINQTSNFKDPLTGLPNLARLQHVASSESVTPPVGSRTLLLIDLDGIHRINDLYGRDAGDLALAYVAGAIRRHLRGGDLLFRHTGDEFVALLSETDAPNALAIATRITEGLVAEPLQLPNAITLSLSVSSASATTPIDGATIDELLTVARARLGRFNDSGSAGPSVARLH